MKEEKNFPVKPRDASTVIIIKEVEGKSYVLMGRRSLKSRFMPGVYVFPGGAVEKSDFLVNRYFALTSKLERAKIKTRSLSHTISLLLAGIRETAEETGLYLAERKSFNKPLLNSSNYTWKDFIKKSYIPNINKLYFFGRAITPSSLKIRFHARFFISFYNYYEGSLRSNGELENIDWIPLDKAKNNKIADVTEFMIDEILKLKGSYKSLKNKKRFPMFTWRNNKRWIKWENIY